MYSGGSGKQITKQLLIKALNRVGDLLKEKNKRIELVCCGGVVSVLYHNSRQMTHDVDALFPNNPTVKKLLVEVIDQVGEELNLEHGERDKWFNDSISFIGLDTVSKTIVFQHSHLVLKAAEWHEMLAHKLTAFRGERDIIDAVAFLKEIKDTDRDQVFKLTNKYRPFLPSIPDNVFSKRFDQIWEKVHGN